MIFNLKYNAEISIKAVNKTFRGKHLEKDFVMRTQKV